MKRIQTFDYIVENVAQAKTVLKNNNISYNNSTFQEILKKTNRDGYTGFITKLVFELNLGLESALNVYELAKEIKLDLGDKRLNDIIKSDEENTKKISNIIRHLKKLKKQEQPFEYLFTENNYKVYLINKYEGILCTGSPAWCLKTKSHYDDYTKTKRGMQFVLIHERFAPQDDMILLTVPNEWKDTRYESGSYSKMRFGVTVYPSGRMDIFDDSNTLITWYKKDISEERYNFLNPILDKISEYHKQNFDTIFDDLNIDDYDDLKDQISEILDDLDLTDSFSNIAPRRSIIIDEDMKTFYSKIEQKLFKNKSQFLTHLYTFRQQVLQDDYFMARNGYMDILVNDMITHNEDVEKVNSVPNITSRLIPLGGYFFDEVEVGDSVIKYSYGYQYSKYGKAAIEQGFGSVENFYNHISNNFDLILLDNTILYINTIAGVLDSSQSSEIKKCISKTPKEDGYEVIINTSRLLTLLKNKSDSHKEYTSKKLCDELMDELKPWFKVKKTDDNNIIVPIYS